MKFRNISKLLSIGILLNSFNLNSFANILSDDGRYETFNGNNITVNDVLEEGNVDVEIEGNTLVNIGIKKSPITSYCSKVTIEDNIITGVSTNATDAGFYFEPTPEAIDMMRGKEVTVFLYNVVASSDSVIAMLNRTQGKYYISRMPIDTIKKDLVFTVTIPNDIKNTDDLEIIIKNPLGLDTWTQIEDKLMILEGDWTDKDAPDYFEGMKSVGEEDGKINIVSQNKNLFDINNITTMSYSNELPYISNTKIDFSITEDTINYTTQSNRWNIGVGGIYKVKKDTLYTVKYEDSSSDTEYDMSVNIIGLYESDLKVPYWNSENYTKYTSRCIDIKQAPGVKNVSLTYDSKDYDYLAIYIGGRWINSPTEPRNITLKNVGIYETGNSDVSYERYNSSEVEVLLNEPLRRLPDGVKDRIIKKNGQWFVERNCKEAILNGSENWNLYQNNEENTISFYTQLNSGISYKKNDPSIIIEHFNNILQSDYYSMQNKDFEWSFYNSQGNPLLFININRDKLSTENVEGFKKWLSENNTKVIYELDEPVYEPINTNLSVQLFEETTHISNSSNIPANMVVTVNRTINRATEAIELAKINPTVENLSKARMWVNLLDDSIKKDALQDEINSITTVEDMTLERKTVTANMDLYIQSENALSMSLNTNSVTFDNYSGVEDVEKLNAVEISINSSLPYDLNAYLESGIINGDASATMDIETLKIRDNSETGYSSFINTNDKITLKNNCSEGNFNIHNIDLKLSGSNSHKPDVYKTVIKFEAVQK